MSIERIDVLAWFDALIERDGLPDDGDTAKARAAVAELIGVAKLDADAHWYFAENGDLRMSTGDHAHREKLLRTALANAGSTP